MCSKFYYSLLLVLQFSIPITFQEIFDKNNSNSIIVKLSNKSPENLEAKRFKCENSSHCGIGGFCDFDYYDWGFCEYCSNLPAECDEDQFITRKGMLECQKICGFREGCTSSYDCRIREFCNFDFEISGVCEECSELKEFGVNCAGLGLITQKGITECRSQCIILPQEIKGWSSAEISTFFCITLMLTLLALTILFFIELNVEKGYIKSVL